MPTRCQPGSPNHRTRLLKILAGLGGKGACLLSGKDLVPAPIFSFGGGWGEFFSFSYPSDIFFPSRKRLGPLKGRAKRTPGWIHAPFPSRLPPASFLPPWPPPPPIVWFSQTEAGGGCYAHGMLALIVNSNQTKQMVLSRCLSMSWFHTWRHILDRGYYAVRIFPQHFHIIPHNRFSFVFSALFSNILLLFVGNETPAFF